MNDWLEYNGNIYVIALDDGNDEFNFQCDGTMCKQAGVIGSIVDTFQSKLKWFNSDYWYTKTSWGKDYPKKVYFQHKKIRPNSKLFTTEAGWKKINEMADQYAIDTDKIMQVILQEVKKKTGKNYRFPEEETDYGMHWYEAYIPLKLGDEEYLLTWENCD